MLDMHSCCCCLRCAPDRDLTTPYTHLGKTEIYSDMLKECFDLHLVVDGDGSCGICSACAGRLRDASDFKLQVQRSQAALRARLRVAPPVKEEGPAVKQEREDGDMGSEESVFDENLEVQLEMTVAGVGDGDRTCDEDEPISRTVKIESKEDDLHEMSLALAGCAERPISPLAKDQIVKCFVKAERHSCDGAPHASHTSLATSHEPRRASRVKETHDSTAEEAYTCDTCGKHFAGKSGLITHVRGHLARIHTKEKSYKCKMCNKRFTRKGNLERHTKNHAGRNTYSCEECYMTFSSRWNLVRHKTVHSDEKPYSCDECNKQFRQKKNLIAHTIRTHARERPFKCTECKKRFSEKSKLIIHARVHSGEKPYRCNECNKLFSQKGHLDEHKRIHTGEKPYKCIYCSKTFSAKYNYKRHISIHSNSAQSVILGL